MRREFAFVLILLCAAACAVFAPRFNKANQATSIVHAAVESPSWYITDLGPKTIREDGSDGGVTVDGMWYATSSIKDKQLVDPIAVKIDCDRAVHICREFDATVSMGMLKPDSDDYKITSWTAKRILAVDADEGKCNVTHRLVMDFTSRTVTLTDLPSQVDTDECRRLRDANSYVLHKGGVMLYPPANYDPLAKRKD